MKNFRCVECRKGILIIYFVCRYRFDIHNDWQLFQPFDHSRSVRFLYCCVHPVHVLYVCICLVCQPIGPRFTKQNGCIHVISNLKHERGGGGCSPHPLRPARHMPPVENYSTAAVLPPPGETVNVVLVYTIPLCFVCFCVNGRMKERRYFKLRRAKWWAGMLLVVKGWRISLAEAAEVTHASA